MSKSSASAIEKNKIEHRVSLVNQITDCRSLGEVQSLLTSLINDYGLEAGINFDSGYNNISEDIVLVREETDLEYNTRIDKEITALIKKENSSKTEVETLSAKIEALKAAKVQ